MRLLVTALIAAALVVPTTALAGASSSASSAAPAALAKKGKKKQRQTRAAKKSSATARAAKKNAASGEREVKGTITTLGGGTITVGALSCAVPSTFTLGAFAVGDLVEIKCTLVGGAWTLRKIEREDAAVTGTQVEVKGAITALGATIDVGAVSCVVPAGVTLGAFAVGDVVEMKCRTVAGVLTLYRVKKGSSSHDEVEVRGAIGAIGGGGGVTVGTTTCAIPTGAVLAGFAVGDVVEMECRTVAGVLTLERLKAEDDDHASDPDDDEDDDDDRSGSDSEDDDDEHSGSGSEHDS
jgi:hypothetical protein